MKRVHFSSPNNSIQLFEKELPVSSVNSIFRFQRHYPDCKETTKFPCTYRTAVFDTKEEWDDYQTNKHLKNKSTGFKTVSSHRRHIKSTLHRNGDSFNKRIPNEWRIYNIDTGSIVDGREIQDGVVKNR